MALARRVRTWLTSCVRNRAVDIVRAMRERPVGDEDGMLLALEDGAPAVHDQVTGGIDGEATRRALVALPGEQRPSGRPVRSAISP